ncbi:hypothetical protein HDV02_005581 [Globomyces sp. JEL0801]|nr:hypothetical protein HDV02_005581 [Globomyces sp. JEL0801]
MTKPELPLPSNTDVNSNKGVWKKISSRCWKTKPNAEKKRLYDTSNEELAKKIDQYNCLMDSAVQMSKLLDVSEATIKSLKEQQRRDTLTYQEELKLKENLIAILKVQNSSLKDSLLNHSCGKNLTPLKTEILPKLPAQQANYGLNQIKFDVSAITKQSGTFQKEDGLNPKSGLKVDASHYKTESSGTNIHPFYSNYKTDMNVMLQNQVHDKKCTTNSEKAPLQAFYSVPPRQFSLLKRESVPLLSPKVISEDSTATIGQNDEMNLDLCLPDYMDDDDEVDQGCIIRSDNYNVEEREITLQSNDNVNFWGSKVTDLCDWNKLRARDINLPFGKTPFGNSNLEKQDISNLKQAFKPIMCDPTRSFKSLYNIEERPFCQGGSCVVYNGVSIGSATNQVIVKKVISFQHREDAISEMKILSKLRHSQIVTLLDYFIETDNIYLVFPKWGTLWINERHPSHSGYTLRHFLASKASAVTLVINGQLIELEIIFKILVL